MTFLGFGWGAETVDVCAANFALRPRIWVKLAVCLAQGLANHWAEPQPQICCGGRAAGRSLVIILLFLGCGLDRAGRGSWELLRSSSSTAEASRLRQTTVETKFDLP